MSNAQLILSKRASGQIRARVRLCDQAPPPRAAVGGALSKHQNLQTDETTGEVRESAPVLTLHGKRLISEYAAAIERKYGKQHCIFLTGTLPGSTVEALTEIAKCQKTIQRRLRQWLHDVTACSVAAVIVWEYQKRGALHLHVLVGHDDSRKLRLIRRGFRQYWVGLLSRLSDERGVDLFATSDGRSHRTTPHVVRAWAQPVKKTVSSYLAKYLSKSGGSNVPYGAKHISRLWGATRQARLLWKSFTELVISAPAPLSEVGALWEAVHTRLSVAVVPMFTWERMYSQSERALAACLSSEQQEHHWNSLVTELGCTWVEPVIQLSTQSTEDTSAPYSLERTCLLFGGKIIGSPAAAG